MSDAQISTNARAPMYSIQHYEPREIHLVSGYIRMAQKWFDAIANQKAYYTIPSTITQIILFYSREPEYFTVHGDTIKLSDDSLSASCLQSIPRGHSVYGYQKIAVSPKGSEESAAVCHYRYIWTFDTTQIARNVIYKIGIDASNKLELDRSFDFKSNQTCHYSVQLYLGQAKLFSHDMSHRREKAIMYAVEDSFNEIKMELNTKEQTIKFVVNGKDKGIAFDQVYCEGTEYFMAVSMDDVATIRLTHFARIRIE